MRYLRNIDQEDWARKHLVKVTSNTRFGLWAQKEVMIVSSESRIPRKCSLLGIIKARPSIED